MLARILDLSTFTGDTWAQAGLQTAPLGSVARMLATDSRLLWRVIPYDGVTPGVSAPVDDTTTTVDARLVVLGNGLADTPLLSSCTGSEQPVGLRLEDFGIVKGDLFVFAIPTITIGTAAALWIFADYGAVLA